MTREVTPARQALIEKIEAELQLGATATWPSVGRRTALLRDALALLRSESGNVECALTVLIKRLEMIIVRATNAYPVVHVSTLQDALMLLKSRGVNDPAC